MGEPFARLHKQAQLRKTFHLEVNNNIIIKLERNAQGKRYDLDRVYCLLVP
jgi:hypothetical protein